MSNEEEIKALETKLYELTTELQALRKANPGREVPNYTFSTLDGETTLADLFGGHDRLLVIHNMGQGCRYCTLWADGFNGFLPHLESAVSVVLVSKDPPAVQRAFANSRGWRFRLASHGGGDYIREQTAQTGADNMPGVVAYERQGEKILRTNAAVFGPGDEFCSLWNLLGLTGLGEADWTPQFRYWTRPEKLDDGGANVID
jgi:predicted dithiol-disulfide oxidoreductase (DUF899 family)